MTLEAFKIAAPSPSPLRKKDSKLQKVYARPREIHEKLKELLALSRPEILSRCQIPNKDNSGYIPSECLVYLLRACREESASIYFEGVYKALLSRIVRRTRPLARPDGDSVSLQECSVRDRVVDRFNELLARDRNGYVDKLDFYEVRFDKTLKLLTIAAQRQVWKETKRSAPIEDPETREIFAEVDEAAGSFNPLAESDSEKKDYQSRLEAAIDTLPPEQKRIVTMLKMGFPIDSKDPETVTIAKALKRSEKTIRTHRDKAFASIRAFFEKGDEQ